MDNDPQIYGEVTTELVKTEWAHCQFEWGLDPYVTIRTEQGLRLILMEVRRVVAPRDKAGEILRSPVLSCTLEPYYGG